MQEVAYAQEGQHERVNNAHVFCINVNIGWNILLRVRVGRPQRMNACIAQKREYVSLYTPYFFHL